MKQPEVRDTYLVFFGFNRTHRFVKDPDGIRATDITSDNANESVEIKRLIIGMDEEIEKFPQAVVVQRVMRNVLLQTPIRRTIPTKDLSDMFGPKFEYLIGNVDNLPPVKINLASSQDRPYRIGNYDSYGNRVR